MQIRSAAASTLRPVREDGPDEDVKSIRAIAKHPAAVRAAVDMFIDQARALLESSARPE